MANMSAQILRNLVSSVFDVPATGVILSGEIAPNFRGTYTSGIAYMSHSEIGVKNVWGFNPKTGFKRMNCIDHCYMSYGNHEQSWDYGVDLCHCDGAGDCIFFVVESFNDEENKSYYTIYKAPDFAEYLAAIEEEDIKRWQEWIGQDTATVNTVEGIYEVFDHNKTPYEKYTVYCMNGGVFRELVSLDAEYINGHIIWNKNSYPQKPGVTKLFPR